ncbi:MAG: DNA internalization-related competence protein ComEC/Rec2 [Vicinamibacterales bacterium]
MRYPSVAPALALVAGAALGIWWSTAPAAVSAALVVGAGLSLLAWRQQCAPAFVASALFTFAVCGYALGSTASDRATRSQLRSALVEAAGPRAVSDASGETVTLIGRLTADASPGESGVRLALSVRQAIIAGRSRRAEGGVLLTVAGDAPPDRIEQWRRGRLVMLPAQLRRPSRYLNPGAGGEETALARRGTTLVGGVKSALLVQVVGKGRIDAEAASELRSRIRRSVDQSVGARSARSAAIVKAILLGDRAGLDEETEERLQEAGTYHVIAISGGNIAILAAALMAAASLAGVRAGVAHISVAVLLAGYACLVGGGASVVRATQMAVLYLVAHAVDHRARPYNTIGASAGATIALDPLAVCDAGAWLTYGATAAILAGTPLLLARLATAPLAVKAPAGLLAASISAELALFPVSALVFCRVTAAGLLLNFAAIPLMTIVQAGGMALVAVHVLVPGAVPPVSWVTHLAAWGLVESARIVDAMPWAVARVPAPGPCIMAAYYAGWCGWFAAAHLPASWCRRPAAARWVRRAMLAGAVACGGWIALSLPLRFGRTPFVVATFIDVGQGAATLIRFPSGHALLVDAGGAGGGRFDIGRRVVEPAIWAAGVHRVTHLVATHGDADHAGGARSIVADMRPREVWEGVPVPPEPLLRDLKLAAGRAGASWRSVQRGDRVRFGDAEVVVWNPEPPEWERQRVRNDDSVVVEVRIGDVSLLLTGDIEASAEAAIAPSIGPAGIRVMLAPHHGSATSSTRALLSAAAPQLAVISAGRGNRYGHPHAAVLERYAAIGARVLRTDVDGAISLRTDGQTVEVTTFMGRRLTLGPDRRAPHVPPA